MKPSLKLIGTSRVMGRMEQVRKRVPNASLISMRRGCELLRGYIVKKKLSGQVLKVRTNRLRSSIQTEVTQQKDITIGKVGTNVKYGRIHELGGTIKAHTVYPVEASALHFYIGGHEVFCRSANIPDIVIPAKHYIGNSMKEIRPALQKQIGKNFFAEVTSG